MADLEQLLTGIHYEEEAIRRAIETVQLSRYFGSLTADELINLLLLRD